MSSIYITNCASLYRENKTRCIPRCWIFCKQVFATVDWIRDELWYVVTAVVIECVYDNASKIVIMSSIVTNNKLQKKKTNNPPPPKKKK